MAHKQRVRQLELSLETERQTSTTLKEQLSRTDQQTSQTIEQLKTALDTETKHCNELHRYDIKYILCVMAGALTNKTPFWRYVSVDFISSYLAVLIDFQVVSC